MTRDINAEAGTGRGAAGGGTRDINAEAGTGRGAAGGGTGGMPAASTDWPVLFFAKGSYSGVYFGDSRLESCAFCDGLSEGADLCGPFACAGYLWPEDERELREAEDAGEVARALTDLADKMEQRRLSKEGHAP